MVNWYKFVKSEYENIPIGYEEFNEEDYDMDSFADQAWQLALNSPINILSDKELARVAVADNIVLGALWTAWDRYGGFSFDVVVNPDFQRQGVGTNLVDSAIEIFNWESDAFDNPHFDLDVTNEHMVSLLKKKGFIISGIENGHTLMTKLEKV